MQSLTVSQIIVSTYLGLGAFLVFLTPFRRAIIAGLSPKERDSLPKWKVGIFYFIILATSIAFYPLFISGWIKSNRSALDELLANPEFQKQKASFDALDEFNQGGTDTDDIPEGYGAFGLKLSNPIPTRTTFGSVSYLGRLQTADGQTVRVERIGSFSSPVTEMPVDGYELKDSQGLILSVIYISPYHKRNSAKAPEGFRLIQ